MKKPLPPITEKQKEVLDVFKEAGQELSPHEAASKLGHNESAPIFGAIKSLIRRKLLKQTKKGRHAKYKSE